MSFKVLFEKQTFFHSFRAGGPGGTRRHCIQGGGVRECCHPVDSGLQSYSPETYVVQYGTSRETLVHNSSRRASEVGTTTYSVPLSGVRDNTTYYVQVLATNTALRSSRSSVESFTILTSAGVRYEYLLFVCLCTAMLFVCVLCVSTSHTK